MTQRDPMVDAETGQSANSGTLYICGTPIGNLEDITLRALRILRSVDIIAAEDTRHTRKLLTAYELQTPLVSVHEHNEQARIPQIMQLLSEGKSVAMVSDAGMPGISDPGALVVRACIDAGFPVVPIPGPTAFVTGLVASGLPTEAFVFEGFLPRDSKRRRERLQRLASHDQTLIFYEAPHRLQRCLRDMLDVWQDRPAALGRELTKVHEQFVRGSLSELLAWCDGSDVRGECVIMVAGAQPEETNDTPTDDVIRGQLEQLIKDGATRRDAVHQVATELKVSKRVVYDLALRLPD